MSHADDCVYPQAKIWALCTCDARFAKPVPLNREPHEPLCDQFADYIDGYCTCRLIAMVREEQK